MTVMARKNAKVQPLPSDGFATMHPMDDARIDRRLVRLAVGLRLVMPDKEKAVLSLRGLPRGDQADGLYELIIAPVRAPGGLWPESSATGTSPLSDLLRWAADDALERGTVGRGSRMTVLLAATLFDAMSVYWGLVHDTEQERRFRALARVLRQPQDPAPLARAVAYFVEQGTTTVTTRG